jgi:hypothetical protein
MDDDGRDPSARFAGLVFFVMALMVIGIAGLLLWAAS